MYSIRNRNPFYQKNEKKRLVKQKKNTVLYVLKVQYPKQKPFLLEYNGSHRISYKFHSLLGKIQYIFTSWRISCKDFLTSYKTD